MNLEVSVDILFFRERVDGNLPMTLEHNSDSPKRLSWTDSRVSIMDSCHSMPSSLIWALGTLRYHRKALSYRLRIQIVKTLVFPHFDYAALVYMDVDLIQEDLNFKQPTMPVCHLSLVTYHSCQQDKLP